MHGRRWFLITSCACLAAFLLSRQLGAERKRVAVLQPEAAQRVDPPSRPSPPASSWEGTEQDAGVPSDPYANAKQPVQRRFHPRAEGEWQGMRVRLDRQPICAGGQSCGLALACKDSRCGPCLSDDECAEGEVCVLDHCVLEDAVGCTSRQDCEDGSLCALSGYTAGLRGNEDMRAFCLATSGGTPQSPEALETRRGTAAAPPPVQASAILEELKAHRSRSTE